MIIETQPDHISILHKEIVVLISGYVKLVYEDNGLTVVVDSIPDMFFNNVNISDIQSDIIIELE